MLGKGVKEREWDETAGVGVVRGKGANGRRTGEWGEPRREEPGNLAMGRSLVSISRSVPNNWL